MDVIKPPRAQLGQDSAHLVGQTSTAPRGQSGLDPAGCNRGSWSRPGQQPIDEGSMDHVSQMCHTSYHQLRQLQVIRRSLTTGACIQLVHALVNSRLDYCNSLLSGVTHQLLSQLQSVLRASARLVLRKLDHVSSNIQEKLHWLPIRQSLQSSVDAIVGNSALRIPRTPRSF